MFSVLPQQEIDIVASDGTVRHHTTAIVSAKGITIPDGSLEIHPGDEIRRRIPSGVEEVFEVIDPVYSQGVGPIPPHYKVKVRKKGMGGGSRPHGGRYNVHVTGPNARVNIGSHDHSTNVTAAGDVFGDISTALRGVVKDADELQRLLSAVDEMKAHRSGAGFTEAYKNFVSLAANHFGILAPFLPALSQLL